MSFFKSPVQAKIVNPLDALPLRARDAEENATVTVTEVRSIESASGWAGIIWETEIQVDGQPSPIPGGQNGIKGVDFMVTVAGKGGEPLTSVNVTRDGARLEQRFGHAYAAAGHALEVSEEGFTLPGGLALNSEQLEEALRSIEGRAFRAKVWAYGSDDKRGIDFAAVAPEG